jgi:hypothetical protein
MTEEDYNYIVYLDLNLSNIQCNIEIDIIIIFFLLQLGVHPVAVDLTLT